MKSIFFITALTLSTNLFAKAAPSFNGDLLGGGRASLAKYLSEAEKNQKPIILSFWATWCAPCMQELKSITEKLSNDPELKADLVTVNVDTSETTSDVKPTLKLYKFNFPVVLDPKHEIFSKYQDSKDLPFSVLITPKGEIAATFKGYDESMFTKIKEAAKSGGGKNGA
jgi:cytochrome c biogenesis protein CcmG, thiol:disulfide interchange protein DsbE